MKIATTQYDPDTGEVVISYVDGSSRRTPGIPHGNGRFRVRYNGKEIYVHRLAFIQMTGEADSGLDVDHIDGNPSNNRWANLRLVTDNVNLQNQSRPHSNNKLGLLGVSPYKNKYKAQIMVGGRVRHIGYFFCPQEAHQAYLKAKRELHEGCTI